jgi:hypothetical protein
MGRRRFEILRGTQDDKRAFRQRFRHFKTPSILNIELRYKKLVFVPEGAGVCRFRADTQICP